MIRHAYNTKAGKKTTETERKQNKTETKEEQEKASVRPYIYNCINITCLLAE